MSIESSTEPDAAGPVERRSDRSLDAVVVGAGFAGLYMLHRFQQMGLSTKVFEAADEVGGTWFWNRYPGARCDMESLAYSYSFSEELQQEWQWSERYPAQPEILRYLNHVADRFDLRRNIECGKRVTSATFDEATDRWLIGVDSGDQVSAKYCVMASGCLSTPYFPDIPGIETFAGTTYHTGRWPQAEVDFSDQRVGIIGTASTGLQLVPEIAQRASHLFVFQRRPSFSMPAHNAPLAPDIQLGMKADYAAHRETARASLFGVNLKINENSAKSALEVSPEERRREYDERWAEGGLNMLVAFADLLVSKEANDTAAEFVRDKIREIVHDPAVAQLLTPTDYPIACKRLCVDTGYYATFNRDNVTLVDIKSSPIESVTPTGLRTEDLTFELDSIVLATGFDAMTGALEAIDIRGRSGTTLHDKWATGPRTYLGLASTGFPNLFLITGPGSPSVVSNMVVSIEQHVDWVANCVDYLQGRAARTIEPMPDAEDAWVAHVEEVGSHTLLSETKSWYTGSNVPGKPRTLMPYLGGVGAYRSKCDNVAENGYEGFSIEA